MKRRPGPWLFLALLAGSTPVLAVGPNPRQDLEELNKRLEERRREMGGILQRENSVLRNLRRVDEGLLAAAAQQRQLAQREKELALRQEEGRQRSAQLAARSEVARRNLAMVLRRLYRQGSGGYFSFLLQAASVEEFLVRQALLRRILSANRIALADFRGSLRQLEEEQQRYRRDLEQLSQVRQELARVRQRYQGERQRRETLLKLVHEQKDFYLRSIREMEEASANLQNLVDNLQQKAVPATPPAIPFSSLRRACPWPVSGGKTMHRFGRLYDQRLQSHVRFKGLELRVAEGSEVRAIAAGRVIFAGWLEGYGQMVIIDHGQAYFSLYGSLSRIDKNLGRVLNAGEVLGLSGSTGSLTGPRLYFEIRHKGVAKDPLEWLAPHG